MIRLVFCDYGFSVSALLQHLPSYLGFSYLGRGVSLHSCSSKVQLLVSTLDEGYLLTTAPPDLEHGIAPPALRRLRSHRSRYYTAVEMNYYT